MIESLELITAYVLLIGVASFLEQPVARGFSAFQMNGLIRIGSLTTAVAALAVVDGIRLPSVPWLLAGLGVGVVGGVGSICYCLSLDCMPVSLVVTLANLYLVVTVVLGAVVLHDPLTAFTIAGLACTLAGMLLLVHPPGKYSVHAAARSGAKARRGRAIAVMSLYVLLIGVGTFLEKPLLTGMDATQLNALQAFSMTVVAGVTLAVVRRGVPVSKPSVAGVALGALMGVGSVFYFLALRGLPVSVAAGLSNGSMVVTVLLATIVLRQRLSWVRGGAMALMLLGVTLLAVSPG
jgi:drug/metabolite transporter (DMT)-like permease